MAINTQSLYEEMLGKFGADDGSERFQEQFLRSVNHVSRDLRTRSHQTVVAIEGIESNIDIDADYEESYILGVSHYLRENQEWGVEPSAELERKYNKALARAQTIYFTANPPDTRYMTEGWDE